jgi:hypothetical protein
MLNALFGRKKPCPRQRYAGQNGHDQLFPPRELRFADLPATATRSAEGEKERWQRLMRSYYEATGTWLWCSSLWTCAIPHGGRSCMIDFFIEGSSPL